MKNKAMNEYDYLLFKRHFVASSTLLSKPFLQNWNLVSVLNFHFYIHPDCEYTLYNGINGTCLLFGYILDPLNIQNNNLAVLTSIAGNNQIAGTEIQEICKSTNIYGGRWALFLFRNELEGVWNDATGLKQIFYSANTENVFFASSEELLAMVEDKTIEKNIREKFLDTYPDQAGIWWPGDKTPYPDIKCLIPDFYFDCRRNQVKRFWPDQPYVNYPTRELLNDIFTKLQGMVSSMANRRNLKLALTGGYDSRLALGFIQHLGLNISAYTLLLDNQNLSSPDYYIPKKLSEHYQFYYQAISPMTSDTSFSEVYKKNTSLNRPVFLKMASALYEHWDEQYISVQSVLNEIGRSKYEYKPYMLNIKDLANMTFMGENNFVLDAFDQWLEGVKPVVTGLGYRIEDLFYHEQRMGRWNAMNRKEWDIAQDVFEPFNSRDIIGSVMALPRKLKTNDYNAFYQFLHSNFNEDFSAVPVHFNPKKGAKYNQFKNYLRKIKRFYQV